MRIILKPRTFMKTSLLCLVKSWQFISGLLMVVLTFFSEHLYNPSARLKDNLRDKTSLLPK
uniref:Uncharacterized protein n=1 Tax=Ciona intestinalis TaxID=7719 RepID=H2XKG5_CIOIN